MKSHARTLLYDAAGAINWTRIALGIEQLLVNNGNFLPHADRGSHR
jgi:hypothetical protein